MAYAWQRIGMADRRGKEMTDWKKRKRELRRQALARRDALDPTWRIEASLAMADMARRHISDRTGRHRFRLLADALGSRRAAP